MTRSLDEIQKKIEVMEERVQEVEKINELLNAHIREMYLLYESVRNFSEANSVEEVFKALKKIIRNFFYVEEFSFFKYDPKSQILLVCFSHGLPKRKLKEVFYRPNEGFIGKAFASRNPIYIADVRDLKYFLYYNEPSKKRGCLLYVPVITPSGEVLGVLKLRKPVPNSFSEVDQKVLPQIARQFALTYQRANLFDQLNKDGWVDEATQLYNGKFFKRAFEIEFRRSQRYQHPLSLISITLENYSNLNRRLGMKNMANLMRRLALRIDQTTRKSDLVFRDMPNRFLIMLPETPRHSAEEVSRKIMMELEKELLDNDGNSEVQLTPRLATYPRDTIEPPLLLQLVSEGNTETVN